MAYNNFPVGYQPAIYYPTQSSAYPTQMSVGATQPMQSSIIWVQGEAGAKSYLVAPNTTVQLWDSERQTIYLKSADASGMPSIKVLDYTIRNDGAPSQPNIVNDAPTRNDISSLQEQIDSIKAELKEIRHE